MIIRINNTDYEALEIQNTISSDNREVKKIIFEELPYEVVKDLFVDNVKWFEVYFEDVIEYEEADEDGNVINEITKTKEIIFDNSSYSIAGDITLYRNGNVGIEMCKPTVDELLDYIKNNVSEEVR